ncbi:HEL255Cp [Eremothecium sinecaudum]|uniref:Pre-mRNA-processing factor 19 n=1 Tax=Eremothecium sinecaudum TaxID=45286 RepID=A0A0X8HSH1_9SACH|nr:HEL255Cp [Eremothecium sinecaudum]AMD21026.1 HEL255Cp [Eremothecium sinecaudum]
MFCAISGKPPSVPALSPSSKCIFEKSLLEQYIDEHGTDPISKAPLTKEQIIEVSQTPQQYSLTNAVNSATLNSNYSIPNLLTTLRNEWDAVMLENFELRTQLDTCKKELSKALYRCDAAVRVAAKCTHERDELKHTLTQLTEAIGESPNNGTGESTGNENPTPAPPQLPADLINHMVEQSQEHVNATKHLAKAKAITVKRLVPELEQDDPRSNDTMFHVTKVSTNRLVDTTCRIACVVDASGHRLISNNKIITLEGIPNDARVIHPISNDQLVFSSDTTTGIYDVPSGKLSTFSTADPAISINYNPNIAGDYFVSLSRNKCIYYTAIDGSKSFMLTDTRKLSPEGDLPNNINVHKDGLLIAVQITSNSLAIFSVSTPNEAPTIIPVDFSIKGESIVSYRFGPNGYWLYLHSAHEFHVYDLRKAAGTLALDKLIFESADIVRFDTDKTGKVIFLQMSDKKITSYTYVKAKSAFVEGATKEIEDLSDYMCMYYEEHDKKYLRLLRSSPDSPQNVVPMILRIE